MCWVKQRPPGPLGTFQDSTAAYFRDHSNKNGADNSDDDNGGSPIHTSYDVTHQLPHPHELRTITSSFCSSEAESLYAAQAGLELRILLSLPLLECWHHWWAASMQVLPLSSLADDETEQESK